MFEQLLALPPVAIIATSELFLSHVCITRAWKAKQNFYLHILYMHVSYVADK